MENVFLEEIKDWDSWGKIFQSIPAFEKLVKKIFEKEGLSFGEISHLTAGSNAVFKVDNFVVKIFAPVESGVNTEIDYTCEILGMNRAMSLDINIPNIIASSSIVDKYLFRYIIMDHIKGSEAGGVIKKYSSNEKIDFVAQLKVNIHKMNTIITEEYPAADIKTQVLTNTRWNIFDNQVVVQIKALIDNYGINHKVYVHGDITGDNVMIDEKGKIYIIDFADGTIAPKEYEYPPIIFDLLDFDKIMINEFIGKQNVVEFTEKCFYGILMHEYGAYFMKVICERIMCIEVNALKDILEVKEALRVFFEK